MKKRICLISLVMCLICFLLTLASCGDSTDTDHSSGKNTLYVYNWGEYISDGSEDSLNVNREFEKYCKQELGIDVTVNYSTYSSNEDLYAKLSSGAVTYDVIIPSDYMIARLASSGLLAEINPKKNIDNYKYIDDDFKGLYYDENELYSVPYTYGAVGVIYNTDIISEDEESLGSWGLLWNEKYSGNILQFNNPRDAFGTAQYYLGYSVNSQDKEEWQEALSLLKLQKSVVQSYVMDEVFNKMKGGSAAIAPYYAGDFLTMYADNELLDFYYPSEGTNVFVDAMCVPANTQNYDLAIEYINFMLREDIAIANAEYICYASPHTLVKNNKDYIQYMTEEVHPDAMTVLYEFDMSNAEFYHDLPQETLSTMNTLWEELKIESNIGASIYIICGIIVGAVVFGGIYIGIKKKIRASYYD